MKCLSLLRRVGVTPSLSPARSSHSSAGERVRVTLIPGDGVGPELMDSCQEVLQSLGARIDFEHVYFSEVTSSGLELYQTIVL